MDIYFAYHLKTKDDIVIALLSDLGFESFVEEDDDTTTAYISEVVRTEETQKHIDLILQQYDIDFQVEDILPQNWNALWEASFTPVHVDQFCIVRADFHEKDPVVLYDIVINPKMAFGTGHHATTFMMLSAMENIDFFEKRVFDYGAGTGILAILADKLGSTKIDALDIEIESFESIMENAEINGTKYITAIHGTLDNIPEEIKYDIILANINRNILLQSVTGLQHRLVPDGVLLLSGILIEDKSIIEETYFQVGFSTLFFIEKDGWVCIAMKKIP
ncbi:MAG: 50S ribosomal protein L11 methyltransferase [Saprospiraceae bacterium]|nr:50S ribosomal protein L11 methyltransferase [Saprospiraceae bacterium]